MSVLVFLVLGILLVLHPEQTTALAHRVGVGRGADLIFYLSLAAFSFLMMVLFSRIREMRAHLTPLTREIALVNAGRPAQYEGGQDVERRPVQ